MNTPNPNANESNNNVVAAGASALGADAPARNADNVDKAAPKATSPAKPNYTKMAAQARMSEFKEIELMRVVYAHIAEPGTTSEDMLRPEYWGNVAERVRVGDRIEVSAFDRSWRGELIVVQAHRTSLVVDWYLVPPVQASAAARAGQHPDFDKYRIETGSNRMFRIIRKEDGRVMYDNLPDEITARRQLTEYLNALHR